MDVGMVINHSSIKPFDYLKIVFCFAKVLFLQRQKKGSNE